MRRTLMISGFLGANIEGAIYSDRREKLNGNWNMLPKSITEEFGAEEMKNIPLGAIAVWTLSDKLTAGLQQLMAGARKFRIADISRNDLFAANRETEKETGIKFMTDVNDDIAKEILNS